MEFIQNNIYKQIHKLFGKLSESEKKELIETLKKDTLKADNKERKFGVMKGEVWMADDFNAPIEDMKEYI